MKTFRMVPAMRFDLIKSSCVRHGFPILNHPLQDPSAGYYVATWDTCEKAVAAALCLNYLPNVVVPITYIFPENSHDRA